MQAVKERGIRVSPIPGPNSAIAALCAAGLPTDRFYFCGFLSSKSAESRRQLHEMRDLRATLVIFEAGNRIERMLQCISEVFPDRHCVVAKELTKLHERFVDGRAGELLRQFAADGQLRKGEFVILVDNNDAEAQNGAEDGESELLEVLLDELSLKSAVRIAVRLTGKKKNEIYQRALKLCAGDAD